MIPFIPTHDLLPAQSRMKKLLRKHISLSKPCGLCVYYLIFKYYKCICKSVLLILNPSPAHCSINNKCNNMLQILRAPMC